MLHGLSTLLVETCELALTNRSTVGAPATTTNSSRTSPVGHPRSWQLADVNHTVNPLDRIGGRYESELIDDERCPMTMQVRRTTRGRRSLPAFAVRETLEELPSRRPPEASPALADVQWEQVEPDRYVVRHGARTLGFVDVVGAVFVVLAGPRYSHAVEFAQTLVFAEALGALTGDDPTPDHAVLDHWQAIRQHREGGDT